MNKLVTDHPQNNVEHMLNLAFAKDGEVWIRNGSAHGEKDCTLVDFVKRMCAIYGKHYGGCLYDVTLPDCFGDDLDAMGDMMMECSAEGCPIGTTYFAMVQAAELRERLRKYEDHDVMPDEMERLKKCRHECKIDCLLKEYDRVIVERDALKKAQEARLMTLAEVSRCAFCYVEVNQIVFPALFVGMGRRANGDKCDIFLANRPGSEDCEFWFNLEDYRKGWRCWTEAPTEEQMEAVKYDA